VIDNQLERFVYADSVDEWRKAREYLLTHFSMDQILGMARQIDERDRVWEKS
jgi:hypothetical protein